MAHVPPFRSALVLALALAVASPLALLAPTGASVSVPHPVPGVAAGFTIRPLAAIDVPTAIMFGPGDGDGPDLYVTTLLGSVKRIALTWTPAGPVAGITTTVASGLSGPLGIAFVDGRMFVADSHRGAESGRTDGRVSLVENGVRTPIVDGLPNGRHNTNHLRVGPDGRLYIANGNPNDSGKAGGDPDVFPYSGAILSVDVDEVLASPAILRWKDANGVRLAPGAIATASVNDDFNAKVDVLAYGFRNIFGVAFSPEGVAYTAMNGADVPSSQDALYKIDEAPGTDYRFPFCYHVGKPGAVGDGISAVANPVYPTTDCSEAPLATALLGWHVCATGLDFPTPGAWGFQGVHKRAVYIGECGPFFPDDTVAQGEDGANVHNTGHKVVQVLLDENGDAVEVKDFVTGLGLPTDVLFGPDGAMYVADAGGILRVAPATPATTVTVAAAGFNFVSPVLVVPAGTTVTWLGAALPHTVTTSDTLPEAVTGQANDPLNSDGEADTFAQAFPMGGSYTHTFAVEGDFPYFCEYHRVLGMVGTVQVV